MPDNRRIGVLNEEFFRLIRLLKRDSDRKRDHEKKAVERYFNESQRSNTQNISQDIPYGRFFKRIVIGEEESVEQNL